MQVHQRVYRALRGHRGPELDAALAAALPTADPTVAGALAIDLLERGRPVGLKAVLAGFARLPTPARDAAVAAGSKLAPAIREGVARQDPAMCKAAVQILDEGGWFGMADLLAELVRRGPAESTDAAITTLEAFAQRALDPRESISSRGARGVALALQQVACRPSKTLPESTLEAWLSLTPGVFDEADKALADPKHPLPGRLRRLMSSGASPAARRAWLWLLRYETLEKAASEGPHKLRQRRPDLLGEYWSAHHLLLLGSVRKALGRVRQPLRLTACEPLTDPAMETRAALGRVAAIAVLPAPDPAVWTRLARFSGHPSARVRLAALRRLTADARPAGNTPTAGDQDLGRDGLAKAIACFVGDDLPGVARLATHALGNLTDRPEALRGLGAAARHAEPSVRQAAEARLAPTAFDRLWRSWAQSPSDQRLAAGQAVLKLDTLAHHRLRRRLSGPKPERLRAIQMIGELGQADFFESALRSAVTDPDARLASTAIRALGSGSRPAGLEAVVMGLDHADARVRANAVEALTDRGTPMYAGKLEKLAEQDAPRCRANAIVARARLGLARPEASLRAMLSDARPGYRVSALWAAGALEARGIVGDVAQAVVDDPEPAVRRSADRLIQRWLSDLAVDTPSAPDSSGPSNPSDAPASPTRPTPPTQVAPAAAVPAPDGNPQLVETA